MKRILISTGILAVLLASILNGQVTTTGLSKAEDLTKPVYGLGLAAGWASGVGLSFRCHLPSKSSVQAVFGIIKSSNKLSMTVGGEYQYDLVRNNSTRFFIGSAMSYFYNGINNNEVSEPFRVGAGVGGEFQVQDAIHITVEGLFVYFSDGRILPLPQIAAHFYFF